MSGNIYFCYQITVLIHKLRKEAIWLKELTCSLYHSKLCLPSFTIVKRISFTVFEVLCLSFLDTNHSNSQHWVPKFTKWWIVQLRLLQKGNKTFEKLLGISDEEPVCRHYSNSVVLENSLDQKLSSHFLIYIKTVSCLELQNIELDIRGARETDIEFMNYRREEVILIARSMIQ